MEYLFNIQIELENGNTYIHHKNEKFKVFSDRSISREIKTIQKIINQTDATILYVAPFHETMHHFLQNYIQKKKIVWVIGGHNQINKPPFILNSIDAWQTFINSIKENDRFQIHIHPVLLNIFAKIGPNIQEEIKSAATRLKTIHHFSKTWEYNYKKNKAVWQDHAITDTMQLPQPDVFLLAGPSAWDYINEQTFQKNRTVIWAADTVLPVLYSMNIMPDLVFSIDSGYGSMEHFIGLSSEYINQLNTILDPLSFPKIMELNFNEKWIYESSHPLVQNSGFTSLRLYNGTGDVFGLMSAFFVNQFPDRQMPLIIGRDQKSIQYSTHLNGSAYHRRYGYLQNRTSSLELKFFTFSQKWIKRGRQPESTGAGKR